MTTKTKLWMGGVTALALVALALPSLVTAQYQGGRGHGKPSAIDATQKGGLANEGVIFAAGPTWMEALELTEEQSLQLDTLRLQFQQEQLRTRGQLAASQAELDALLLDPEASRSAVESAGGAVQELRGQVRAQRLGHQMDVRELLTAEQRTLLVQMKARGIAGRGSRGGRGFGLRRGDGHGGPGLGMHTGGGPCGERTARRAPAGMHRRHQHHRDAPAAPELDVEVEVDSEQI